MKSLLRIAALGLLMAAGAAWAKESAETVFLFQNRKVVVLRGAFPAGNGRLRAGQIGASHAARSGPARREFSAHFAGARGHDSGPTIASALSNIDTDT